MVMNTRKRNRDKFNSGLSANPPSNNWALGTRLYFYIIIQPCLRADVSYFLCTKEIGDVCTQARLDDDIKVQPRPQGPVVRRRISA